MHVFLISKLNYGFEKPFVFIYYYKHPMWVFSPLSVLCISGVSLIVSCSCSKVFCGSLLPLESESNWMICLSKNPLLSKGLRSWNTVELFNALSCFL